MGGVALSALPFKRGLMLSGDMTHLVLYRLMTAEAELFRFPFEAQLVRASMGIMAGAAPGLYNGVMNMVHGHSSFHFLVTGDTEVKTGINEPRLEVRSMGVMTDSAVSVLDRLVEKGFGVNIGHFMAAQAERIVGLTKKKGMVRAMGVMTECTVTTLDRIVYRRTGTNLPFDIPVAAGAVGLLVLLYPVSVGIELSPVAL